jgi:hypothetical protein
MSHIATATATPKTPMTKARMPKIRFSVVSVESWRGRKVEAMSGRKVGKNWICGSIVVSPGGRYGVRCASGEDR